MSNTQEEEELTPLQRQAWHMYHKLRLTMKQVGEQMGISRQRVHQLLDPEKEKIRDREGRARRRKTRRKKKVPHE